MIHSLKRGKFRKLCLFRISGHVPHQRFINPSGTLLYETQAVAQWCKICFAFRSCRMNSPGFLSTGWPHLARQLHWEADRLNLSLRHTKIWTRFWSISNQKWNHGSSIAQNLLIRYTCCMYIAILRLHAIKASSFNFDALFSFSTGLGQSPVQHSRPPSQIVHLNQF